ncbi:MAG TPA: hypothetical protein VI854_05430, partial [Acidimicrobiia bacterium]|nr:hypothetical protein [Acidimicrobiia bacterium]
LPIDELTDYVLEELFHRIVALPERVLTACPEGLNWEPDGDDEFGTIRDQIGEALEGLFAPGADLPLMPLELDHRTWYVAGGASSSTLPDGFEAAILVTMSGITDVAVGLTDEDEARWVANRREVHLGLGRSLVGILRSCLEEELRATVAETDDDLADVAGIACRGGRGDWLGP